MGRVGGWLGRVGSWLVGWLVGGLVCRLIGSSVCWLFCLLVGWFAWFVCLACLLGLFAWLAWFVWMICLVSLFVGWLTRSVGLTWPKPGLVGRFVGKGVCLLGWLLGWLESAHNTVNTHPANKSNNQQSNRINGHCHQAAQTMRCTNLTLTRASQPRGKTTKQQTSKPNQPTKPRSTLRKHHTTNQARP